VSEAAKLRYRSGGQFSVPLVIRAPYGGGIRGGHYHSQSPEAFFVHTPGLKVVVPATPADAKGLLLSAIRDPDPVIFMEPKKIYRAAKEEVPADDYTVPLGVARVAQEGTDATVLTYGAMLPVALEAARKLAAEGASVEVLDLRTLLPFDREAILASVKKTGRAVPVVEAPALCSFASEMAAFIQEEALDSLLAPVRRVTGYFTPVPYGLDRLYLPDADRIIEALREVLRYG
jgi:pyruvate/2-oxoglutarate/acetoin dehydrogenase E1 component